MNLKTHFRHVVIPALFLFAACAQIHELTNATVDKYPYGPQFVAPTDLPERALSTPPTKGSPVFEQEIKDIMALQARLQPDQKAAIVAEDHISPEMIVLPVLGAQYTEEKYPALYKLLKHAASDAWRICDVEQDVYQSPRPWTVDERVQLIAPKIVRYGYPSGHTTTNTVWAYILGDIYPDQRDQFIARANDIAQHRVEGGVHFPHDVAGGKDLAGQIYGKMQVNAKFKEELAAAKAELGVVKPTIH